MAATLIQADLLTTMDIASNSIRCHGSVDLVVLAGDYVLTSTYEEYVNQKLIMWLVTACCERVADPMLGCPLWDYMHEILDAMSLMTLSRAMEYSLRKQLPELQVYQVVCSMPANSNQVDITFMTASGIITKLAGSDYFGLVEEMRDYLWSGNN